MHSVIIKTISYIISYWRPASILKKINVMRALAFWPEVAFDQMMSFSIPSGWIDVCSML